MLIWVDSVIVLVGLLAFKDWQIPLYSMIVIYITGRAVDLILDGENYNKALIIISDKHEEIRDIIISELERGGTYLKGVGMFSNEEKNIIFTVVSRREMAILEGHINIIDPNAFITIMNASEILGEGFKSLKNKNRGLLIKVDPTIVDFITVIYINEVDSNPLNQFCHYI